MTPVDPYSAYVCHLPTEGKAAPASPEADEAICVFDPADAMVWGMETEAAWQPQGALQLLGPSCGMAQISAGYCSDLTEPEIVDLPLPLASFDLHDVTQQCIAQNLRSFLQDIDFDGVNRRLHPRSYGVSPVYDNHLSHLDMQRRLAQHSDLSETQGLAPGFFMYGQGLSPQQISQLFGDQIELFQQMQKLGMIIPQQSGDDIVYRLNNLSLVSYQLPNNDTLYLFADLPRRLRTGDRSGATAQLSETSYILLKRLELEFSEQGWGHYQGTLVDFGSGTGILSIALLKMYPDLNRGLAVEIDEHSMNLSRFNAMLSGVEDRFKVIDNSSADNLREALGEEAIDLAVSNPPFNVVPRPFAEEFTDFGDGGPLGMDVISIFLNQALPKLREGASFIAYSHLPAQADGEFFLTQYLRDQDYGGLEVNYEALNFPYLRINARQYALAVAEYLAEQRIRAQGQFVPIRRPGERLAGEELVAKLLSGLQDEGIDHFEPRIWRITPRVEEKGLGIVQSKISLPNLEKHYGLVPTRSQARGGIYRKIQPFESRLGEIDELLQKTRRGGFTIQQIEVSPLNEKALREGLRELLQPPPREP